MRIDAHQHFWTVRRDDYGWLTPKLEPLYRDFQPDDLAPLLAEGGIGRTILVQAAPTVAETRYLLQLAAGTESVAGVVGWIDMASDTAAGDLAELAEDPGLVGIRPMIHNIDDPAWIVRPELAAATQAFIDRGLRFDALVRPVHLPYLLEFLRRHPELKTVIDHGAKPDIAEGRWQPGHGGRRCRRGGDPRGPCRPRARHPDRIGGTRRRGLRAGHLGRPVLAGRSVGRHA